MKIAILSPNEYTTPPPPNIIYANANIASFIAEELVKRGHQVTLCASKRSKTSAKIFSAGLEPLEVVRKRKKLEYDPFKVNNYKRYLMNQTYRLAKSGKFDLVHTHMPFDTAFLSSLVDVPTVFTLHNPLNDYQNYLPILKSPNHYFVSISNNQRKDLSQLKFTATVYNGLEIEKFKYSPQAKDYFIWLGRIHPNKGTLEAVKAAKIAGVKLKIAGKVSIPGSPSYEYWHKHIKKHVDGRQIQYLGMVPHHKISNVLKGAIAFLNPIQWEEPFGLVMIEAMACGTPVISFKRGSASEVVKHNKTGYLVNNVNQMVQAIRKIDQIKRQDCLQWVENKFTTEKMAREYVKIYKKMIKKYKG